MRGVNKALILGTLGKDPDSRITPGGTQVANFSIAVNEFHKDKNTGEKRESTEWLSIVCFGRTAEVAIKYLRKGSRVYIEGKIKTEKYTNKQGIDRYSTKIYCNNLQLLDSRSGSGSPAQNGPKPDLPQRRAEKSSADYALEGEQAFDKPEEPEENTDSRDEFDDDIPF